MTITHRFNNTADLEEGGMWFGDYGELICKWTWYPKSRKLDVRCDPWQSLIDLRKSKDHNFTDEKLKKRLPKTAIKTAERLNNTKYDL